MGQKLQNKGKRAENYDDQERGFRPVNNKKSDFEVKSFGEA